LNILYTPVKGVWVFRSEKPYSKTMPLVKNWFRLLFDLKTIEFRLPDLCRHFVKKLSSELDLKNFNLAINLNFLNSVVCGVVMISSRVQRWVQVEFPILILLLAAVIRYFFIFHWHLAEKFLFSDMGNYFQLGKQLVEGSLTKNHFFQPVGMPLIEAFILTINEGSLSLLSWVHFVLSLLTLFFIWKTTEKLTNSFLALLTLAFASFHYPFIYISGTYLSECIFTFIISLMVWLLVLKPYPWRPLWAIFLGLFMGMSFWLKGTFILYLPILMFWILIKNYSHIKKSITSILELFRIFKSFIFLSSGVAALMLGHGILSYNSVDQFLVSPTNGGLNFLEGKCPWKDNHAPDGNWLSPLYTQLGDYQTRHWDVPFSNSSYYFQQGLLCIANDPMVLVKSFQAIPYLFYNNDFWPTLNTKPEYKSLSRNYALFFVFWLLPAFVFAMLYLCKHQRTDQFLAWVFPVLTLFLTGLIFKSELRYRIPFDVVFIPLGIYGWDLIISSIFSEWSELRRYKAQAVVIGLSGILVTVTLIWP
jgi:hypothetical protein